MAEAAQQNRTLSLRISEALRKRLEEIRKVTALRKGENVSTSEIAKQLLKGAREERLEVVELLGDVTESLARMRRNAEAGQMLSRAEWTVLRRRHGDAGVRRQRATNPEDDPERHHNLRV